jgi:hypothetical protein
MRQYVTRCAVMLAATTAVVMVTGCTSDIDYHGYLPSALSEGSQSVLKARESGECSVEVFRISDGVAADLASEGLGFFSTSPAIISSKPVKGSRIEYSFWQSGPMLDTALSDPVRAKASWSLRCLSQAPEIKAAYENALNLSGVAYFTYSTENSLQPDLLVVLPSVETVIVAPH